MFWTLPPCCAFVFDEPGADHVGARLTGALVSAVTHSDVIAALIRRGAPADEMVGMLIDLDIEVVPVDRHQAELAGILRGTTANGELSPGDCACLALATTRRAVVVTCHRDGRTWRSP